MSQCTNENLTRQSLGGNHSTKVSTECPVRSAHNEALPEPHYDDYRAGSLLLKFDEIR